MPFGSLLSYAKGKSVKTADETSITIGTLGSIGLKILGIPHLGNRARARIINKYIKKTKNKTALDAGCGIGLYSFEIAKKGYSVTGIDFDNEKIITAKDISKKSKINVDFKTGDITKMKYKNSFDLVLCSDVLEHINQDELALDNLISALKKEGNLILTIPRNTPYTLKNSEYIKNYKRFFHERPGYKDKELIEKLKKKGLKIIIKRSYSSPIFRFAFSINEKLYKHQILLGIFFYPLYLLTYFDFLYDSENDGLFILAKKITI
ncbi:MAG: class I SAM-dependent methyltransferase [Candidatus Pacearchaeota archaeon]|jgi:ubiquinone biosynthesis O-methyltransferase